MKSQIVIFCLLFSLTAALSDVTIPEGVSVSATRNVDITSQLVKVSTDYEIKNQGKTELNFFVHAIPEGEATHLAYIGAKENKKDAAILKISKTGVNGAPKGFAFYKIELNHLVGAGASVNLVVEYVLTEFLKPYPAEITQAENQFILYEGDALVSSAYPVEKETSHFKIGTGKLVSHTQTNGKHVGDKITYGPFTDQKPYSEKKISIHYENNSPFLVAVEVERWIEVSHWGNIAIEEKIEVVHKGAKLKGPFSRIDYQMDRRGPKQPSIKSWRTILPAAAKDIYYRDQIGNISTSMVNAKHDATDVELRPRFPLFGGWRTNYILGYNVPSYEFIFSSGSDYALKIRLVDHLWDNSVIENLRVKIVLPETSRSIKVAQPYSVKRLPDEIHKTYLDTTGRPVIVLEKQNVVENHVQQITVYYEFDRIYLLREPLIAVAAFLILFIAVIIFVRLDFSISSDPAADTKSAHIKKD